MFDNQASRRSIMRGALVTAAALSLPAARAAATETGAEHIVLLGDSIFANAAYAAATAAVAMGISWPVASHFAGPGQLVMATGLYGLVVASSYFMVRARLRIIIG